MERVVIDIQVSIRNSEYSIYGDNVTAHLDTHFAPNEDGKLMLFVETAHAVNNIAESLAVTALNSYLKKKSKKENEDSAKEYEEQHGVRSPND